MTLIAQAGEAFNFASKGADFGPAGYLLGVLVLGGFAVGIIFVRPWVMQKLDHNDKAFKNEQARLDKRLELESKVADALVKLVEGHQETLDVVLAIRAEQIVQKDTTAALVAATRHQTEAFKKINADTGGRYGIDEEIGGMREALHDAGDDTGLHKLPPLPPPQPPSGRTRRP